VVRIEARHRIELSLDLMEDNIGKPIDTKFTSIRTSRLAYRWKTWEEIVGTYEVKCRRMQWKANRWLHRWVRLRFVFDLRFRHMTSEKDIKYRQKRWLHRVVEEIKKTSIVSQITAMHQLSSKDSDIPVKRSTESTGSSVVESKNLKKSIWMDG